MPVSDRKLLEKERQSQRQGNTIGLQSCHREQSHLYTGRETAESKRNRVRVVMHTGR